MKVRVLGCSGAIAKDCRTTSFLLDHDVLGNLAIGQALFDELQHFDFTPAQ